MEIENPDRIQLRPRPLPLVVLLAVMIVFSFLNVRLSHDKSSLVVLVIFVATGLILSLFFWKASIVIEADTIYYRNLFFKKTIFLPSVTRTYVKFHHRGKSSSYYWHFETNDQRKDQFSIRFYSRNSLRTLAQTVIEKCRSADIDARIQDMAEGQFPWRIF